MKITYNKSEIMSRAWQIFRTDKDLNFGDALRQSWNIAKNGHAVNHFNTIYKEHYKSIYNLIFNKVNRNTHIAEELTNDVFLKFKARITYDVYRAKIITLLYVIAKNVVIDHYRTNHQDHFKSVGDYVDSEGKDLFTFNSDEQANDMVESQEKRAKIAKAFRSLNPKSRKIATMFFLRERSYDEIAEQMQIPVGSVKGTISRCRTALQHELSTMYSNA